MAVITIVYFNFYTRYYSLKLEKQQLQLKKQQIELKRQQIKLDAYLKNSAVTNELIDFVRMRQHGISNILTSPAALSKIHTDYDSLSSALEKATDVYIADNAPVTLLEIKPRQIVTKNPGPVMTSQL